MADMLSTAFFNSNRFIVLERETLKDILAEQDLGASGRVEKETAAPIGEMEGTELLVTGTVTGFEPWSAGRGGVIGGISGTWPEFCLVPKWAGNLAVILKCLLKRPSGWL